MFLLGFLIVFSACILFFAYIFIRARLSPLYREIPGRPLYNPVFGNTLETEGDAFFSQWKENVKRYGRIHRFYATFGEEWLIVSDPTAVKHILIANGKNYFRGPLTSVQSLKRIVGTSSMVLTDGPVHRKHRNLTSPAFRVANLKKLVPVFQTCAEKLVQFWNADMDARGSGVLESVDVRRYISRATLAVIGLAGFGFDFECIGGQDSEMIRGLEALTGVGPFEDINLTPIWRFLPFYDYMPSKRMSAVVFGMRRMHALINAMVSAKQSVDTSVTHRSEKNLLDIILAASQEDSAAGAQECLSNSELRDEMMTFILAGHETSSLAITYTLWQLCRYPQWQDTCRSEVNAKLEGQLSWENVEALRYTKAVIHETLRLYPPVPVVPRTSIESDLIGGYKIPPGTRFAVLMAQMQRLPEVWKDPEMFLPERFLESDVPWDAWMPFGDGIHKCVGYQFALNEIAVILALLLKNFKFSMRDENDVNSVKLQVSVTMHPSKPILMDMERVQ